MFKKLAFIAISLLVIIRIFLATQVPAHEIYTIDERIAVHSGLLMMVNTTPICLEWPGGPLLMIISALGYIKLILTTSFIKLLVVADVMGIGETVTAFIASNINALQFYVVVRTVLQISGILLFLILMSSKKLKTMPGRTYFALLLLSSPVLLNAGMIIHPDSLAVFIWAPLLCFIFYDTSVKWGNILRIGILLGILLSIKLTYVVGVPFLILYTFIEISRKENVLYAAKHTFMIGIVAVAVFVTFCPFLLTDTLTLLKAFAGQLVAKTNAGTNSWDKLFKLFLPNLIALPFIFLSFFGLIFGLIKRINIRILLLFALLLIFSLPFAKSEATHTRYCFPFIPILIILSYDGWLVIRKYLDEKSNSIKISFLTVLLAASLFGWIQYRESWTQQFFSASNLSQLTEYIGNNVESDITLVLPEDLMFFFEENKESLDRLITKNSDRAGVLKKLNVIRAGDSEMADSPIGYFAANAIFADHSNYMNTYLSIKKEYSGINKNPDRVYNIYYYSDASYSAVTSISIESINTIQSPGYFVSYQPKPDAGTLVKTFDASKGKICYLYKL